MSHSLGYSAMRECITTGGDIAKTLNNLFNERANGGKSVAELLGGSIECVRKTYLAIRNAGLVTPTGDKELDEFLQLGPAMLTAELTRNLNSTDAELTGKHVSGLIYFVNNHRKKLSWPEPVPPKNEAPPVPAPLDVRVVSMPDRIRETDIERRIDGNISTAITRERDSQPWDAA